MRKWTVSLLCILLLCGSVSCSLAGPVACPEAHLVLTVPDSWRNVPLSSADDPDLYLLLEGDGISLSVYIADAGGLLPGAFQVFTGDETDSGTLTVQGVEKDPWTGKRSARDTGAKGRARAFRARAQREISGKASSFYAH